MKATELKASSSNPPKSSGSANPSSNVIIPWLLEAIPASSFEKVLRVLGLSNGSPWEPPPREGNHVLYSEGVSDDAIDCCKRSRERARFCL